MRRDYFAGLDLGKSHDFTALVVVERAELRGEWDAAAYGYRKRTELRLRFVERIPLGTEYRDIVERVRRVMGSPALDGARHLAVDATGVGNPVIELLRRPPMDCRLWPVSITGGEAEGYGNQMFRVPKRDLVVGLQLLIEAGALRIAEGLREREALVREMSEMRVKVTASGHEQYEAGRSGQHDDLVSALSLACWAVRKTGGGGVGERRGRVV